MGKNIFLSRRIYQNPGLARWKTEVRTRQANIAAERAGRIEIPQIPISGEADHLGSMN